MPRSSSRRWELVPVALRAVTKGGTVVCAGIHMSPIPSFRYELLWGERSIRSVANLTRKDGDDFFRVTTELPLKVGIERLPLAEAHAGLDRLRTPGTFRIVACDASGKHCDTSAVVVKAPLLRDTTIPPGGRVRVGPEKH